MSDVAFGWKSVEVTARRHPLVEHAHNFDHTFLGDAIVEKVAACMSDVEAADTRTKFRPPFGKQPFGLGRDLPHRVRENSCILQPALGAPPMAACRKDVGKIDLRWVPAGTSFTVSGGVATVNCARSLSPD